MILAFKFENIYPGDLGCELNLASGMVIFSIHARGIVNLALENIEPFFCSFKKTACGLDLRRFHTLPRVLSENRQLSKVGSNLDRVTSLDGDVPSINASLHVCQYC